MIGTIGKMAALAFMVMLFIYLFKWAGKTWQIPVVSQVTEAI